MVTTSSKNEILWMAIFFYSIFAYAEFPISRNLQHVMLEGSHEKLTTKTQIIASPYPLQKRHKKLKYSPYVSDKKNYFSCCFVFKLNTKQEIEIPLLKIFVSTGVKKQIIDECHLKKITIQQKNPFVFVSHEPNIEVYNCLSNLHLQFYSSVNNDTAATKNQAMLLKAINERQIFKKDKLGEEKNAVINVMRSTDSEAGALYVLQHKYVIDNIIDELCKQVNSLPGTPQITSIEFHGCTTRDMCPLCFTNMNIIQYLCNDTAHYDSNQFSFLKYLKHILTDPITEAFNNKHTNAIKAKRYAIPNCPTKMFISSTRVDDKNLNFQGDGEGEQDNYLHQFRILDKEEDL